MSHTICKLGALEAIEQFKSEGRPANLVYIDPPFGTEKDFSYSGTRREESVSYSDKWGGLSNYMSFMEDVVRGIHDALDEEGSILLHCDYRANHHLAILLDDVFGVGDRGLKKKQAGFRNEFIWAYGLGGSSKRCYPKKHDTIFWYTKGCNWHFEPPMIPGRASNVPIKKQPDVYDFTFSNMNKERVGYPTQKPTFLLDMFVKAHTKPGELVADFFCGSGTTGVSAVRYGRDAWLSDQSEDAVAISTKRIEEELDIS